MHKADRCASQLLIVVNGEVALILVSRVGFGGAVGAGVLA